MASNTFSISRGFLARVPRYRSLSTLLNTSAAIVGMTSLLLLVQISGVASLAYQVQRLEDQRTYWQESNYRAETEIARLQSLGRIEEEATSRLQMVPAQEPVPVLVPSPLGPPAPAPQAARATLSKAPQDDAWWRGAIEVLGQVWRGR